MSFKSIFVPTSTSYPSVNSEENQIDGEAFASEIEEASNQLGEDGYEIISIIPITDGHFSRAYKASYGFGITSGVVITAKLAF